MQIERGRAALSLDWLGTLSKAEMALRAVRHRARVFGEFRPISSLRGGRTLAVKNLGTQSSQSEKFIIRTSARFSQLRIRIKANVTHFGLLLPLCRSSVSSVTTALIGFVTIYSG